MTNRTKRYLDVAAGMSEPIHVLSLGAGVQSSTMALMAAYGEITPMPIAAIFADTQDEPQSVYRWLDWLEKQLPFPVHRVTAGSLSARSLKMKITKDGRRYSSTDIPFFTLNSDGSQGKIVHRGCTRDFKILPIRRLAKRLGNVPRFTKDRCTFVVQWIGISLDEQVRMKLSRDWWQQNRWPLIELKMRRHDCLQWMKKHGYSEPPRSACVYCPFHSDSEWRRLKLSEPTEFEKALQFEKALHREKHHSQNFHATPFLHRSLKPLGEVDFSTDVERGQGAWWEENFRDECEGMCGV